MRTERTARFEEAVRQLGGGTVEARMGAARTLVILADEWLADTAVTEHERHHQVQTIIDALCESIRSPFSLAYRAELWADEPTGSDSPGSTLSGLNWWLRRRCGAAS